jgi:hypothetical protein
MTEPEATFAHEPINRHLQSIRLICVIPEADGLIECKLKHVDLQSSQTAEYRALSYTWGPPHPVQKMLVNNQSFFVRQNLYDFLKAFRTRLHRFRDCGDYGNEIQWLWIDQICIDQSVVEERNHQVEMMSDIYRRASYVYVWLGRSDKCIETVMKTIKCNFRGHYDRDFATRGQGHHRIAGQESSSTSASGDERPSNKLSVPILRYFFGNPYWLRLWIVQEIMLARYIRVICGETLLSWEELRRFCSSDLKQLPPDVAQAVPSQVIWLTQHALSERQFTYPNLLHTFGMSGCENPKDKVYVLQGIVQREDRPIINYESSVKRIFRDAAASMVRTAIRNSQVRNDADLSRIDYLAPLENAFLNAAALWMKELESAIHLEMIEAWIILENEMGLHSIYEHPGERSRRLQGVQATWSRLAEVEEHQFLRKHRPQFKGVNYHKRYTAYSLLLDPWLPQSLVAQLRNHYGALINILQEIKTDVFPDDTGDDLYYNKTGPDGLYHRYNVVSQHCCCHWPCSQPADVHIIP